MTGAHFFSLQMDESFEETLLRGMVIGYAKADAGELFVHVAHFVPEINDWSTCDSFLQYVKICPEGSRTGVGFFATYFSSEREFEVRFWRGDAFGSFYPRGIF